MFPTADIKDHSELEQRADECASHDPERWACAVNVAGRVVAHIDSGWPFASVVVVDGSCVEYADESRPSPEDEAKSIAAGIAVESAICQTPRSELLDANAPDLEYVAELLGVRLAFDAPVVVAGFDEIGADINSRFADSIRLIAVELYEVESLTEAKCKALFHVGRAMP